ncbi:hypothetical protein GB993_02790 [Lactobacillus rossiae]|uniref:Pyridine nucleotide-disulphide oxidoreductase dimerisation domain-containing protein n=1 Tax=Furfurilactobacillus milii TaxID=2888272 RepID=A0A6N9I208_9LACO|nr:hypothetical protein [Furfurilactobacillus milii]
MKLFQGKYLGQNLDQSVVFPIKYPVPALSVFSIPKLGQVGISTQQAAGNSNLQVKTVDLSGWQAYARNGDQLATLKLVVNRSSEQIVGAEVLSQNADELVDFLALLITQKISAQDLNRQLFAYPSLASDLYGIWQSK